MSDKFTDFQHWHMSRYCNTGNLNHGSVRDRLAIWNAAQEKPNKRIQELESAIYYFLGIHDDYFEDEARHIESVSKLKNLVSNKND